MLSGQWHARVDEKKKTVFVFNYGTYKRLIFSMLACVSRLKPGMLPLHASSSNVKHGSPNTKQPNNFQVKSTNKQPKCS